MICFDPVAVDRPPDGTSVDQGKGNQAGLCIACTDQATGVMRERRSCTDCNDIARVQERHWQDYRTFCERHRRMVEGQKMEVRVRMQKKARDEV